jgi:hypothetical protein
MAPLWLPPRTTFGAPSTMTSPASAEAASVSRFIGNSAILAPSARKWARISGVVSSWESIGTPSAAAAAAMARMASGTVFARVPTFSSSFM